MERGQGYSAMLYDLAGGPSGLGLALDGTAMRGQQSQHRAEYNADLSYEAFTSSLQYTVACSLNQLVRSLGFAADLQKLERTVAF